MAHLVIYWNTLVICSTINYSYFLLCHGFHGFHGFLCVCLFLFAHNFPCWFEFRYFFCVHVSLNRIHPLLKCHLIFHLMNKYLIICWIFNEIQWLWELKNGNITVWALLKRLHVVTQTNSHLHWNLIITIIIVNTSVLVCLFWASFTSYWYVCVSFFFVFVVSSTALWQTYWMDTTDTVSQFS